MILETDMVKMLENYDKNSEIEIRMGNFRDGNFNTDIGEYIYNKLLGSLFSDANLRYARNEYVIELYNKGYRINHYVQSKTYEQKYSINKIDNYNGNMRISHSKEYKVSEAFFEDKRPSIIKTRVRYSFMDSSETYRIDIGKDFLRSNSSTTFHYEIELLKPSIQTLQFFVNYFHNLANEEFSLYTQQSIIDEFNVLLSVKNKKNISPKTVGRKPIDFQISDVLKMTDYLVYCKLDGVGYSLFIDKQGDAYLVNPTNVIPWKTRTGKSNRNTIITGELINSTYYVYDLFIYKGNKLMTTYLNRREIISKIFLDLTIIDAQPAYQIRKLKCTERTDGYIFQPINQKDVPLKWKPPHHLTIDFIQNNDKLYVYDSKGNLVPFNTNEPYKIMGENSPFVGEYKLTQDNVFIKTRTRYDKEKPNFIEIAESIWKLIKNPISDRLLFSIFDNLPLKKDSTKTKILKLCNLYKSLNENPILFVELKNFDKEVFRLFREELLSSSKSTEKIDIMKTIALKS